MALARDAIEQFVARLKMLNVARVEYVILSHADEDHVNCLKDLLENLRTAKIAVGTVMLPWLDATEKLLAKAHANHRGPSTVVMNLTGTDEDTVGYLVGLGVEGVAFLQTGGPAESPPEVPSVINSVGTPVYAQFVGSGTDLTAGHQIPWKLIAMRMAPPKGTIREFAVKLKSLTGLDPNDPLNHAVLLTSHRREISVAMRAAATAVKFTGYGHSLTNWSCISIFGSSPTPVASHSIPANLPGSFEVDCDYGWLHTGDLPLDIPDVWRAFELLWNVHVTSAELCSLTAPHHGSPNGHNASLYTKFNSRTAIFTTGRSSRSKPGFPVYSHRNAPMKAMQDAGLTSDVIELNNL
jgi:hypothetical protein